MVEMVGRIGKKWLLLYEEPTIYFMKKDYDINGGGTNNKTSAKSQCRNPAYSTDEMSVCVPVDFHSFEGKSKGDQVLDRIEKVGLSYYGRVFFFIEVGIISCTQ